MTIPVTHPDRRCATARPNLFATDDSPRPWGKAQTVAFAFCMRCPMQARCAEWALASGARDLVAGGCYFDSHGRPWRLIPGSTVVAA